jgi:hypothetical protein
MFVFKLLIISVFKLSYYPLMLSKKENIKYLLI